MKKIILSAVLMTGVVLGISAQTRTPQVTNRQVAQQARIRQGVENGELTRREAVKLEQQQRKIQHDKKEAKADGVVTPEERAKLHREQRKAGADIYRQKHDVQKR